MMRKVCKGLYPDIARELVKHLIDVISISAISPEIVSYHNYKDGGIKCIAFSKQNGLDKMEQAEAIWNAIYFPYFAALTKSY